MKRKLLQLYDISFYMVAGLGLFSLLNLIFKGYSEVPILLVIIGLGLGLLIWWRETKAIKEMTFGGNINTLKFYVYFFTFFVYVLAIFGYIEFFTQIFGQSIIEAYRSLTFSWEWVFVLLLYFVGWNESAKRSIEDTMENMNMQKA